MITIKRNIEILAQAMSNQLHATRSTIIVLTILITLYTVSLAALVIGAIRINNCPIQPMIPIWLIVDGATGVAGCTILTILVKIFFCDQHNKCISYKFLYLKCLSYICCEDKHYSKKKLNLLMHFSIGTALFSMLFYFGWTIIVSE